MKTYAGLYAIWHYDSESLVSANGVPVLFENESDAERVAEKMNALHYVIEVDVIGPQRHEIDGEFEGGDRESRALIPPSVRVVSKRKRKQLAE